MTQIKKIQVDYLLSISAICCIIFMASPAYAQEFPVRGYTNPEEIVTFDRTTSYERALDVINRFAQEYAGKLVIDRSTYEGNIGISIPPMHWKDALELILSKHYLTLIENPQYFEIVPYSYGGSEKQVSPVVTVPDSALTTMSKEVRIHAIFFEGSRSALQEIGVDWSTLTNNVPEGVGRFFGQNRGGGGGGGGAGGGGAAGGGNLPVTSDAFDGPFVSVNAKGAKFVSQNVFNAVINFGEVFGSGIRVQALFSAFEAENLGTILASPSIRVLEGQTGKIQVGTDFAINQRDIAGNVITQFYSAGTILEVVPRVIAFRDTTFIHLDLHVERSTVVPDAVSTVIKTQNADSQVLLLDGETTAIAGLYQTQKTTVRRGIPILKDLPAWFFGLRYIFGYTSKTYETRELIVLIQAEVVPSIKQRMNDELAGTFDVLQERRLDIRKNVIKYRESLEYPDVLPTDDPQNIFEEDHELNPPPDTKVSKEDIIEKTEIEQDEEAKINSVNISEMDNDMQMLSSSEEEVDKYRADKYEQGKGRREDEERIVDEDKRETSNATASIESYNYYVIAGSFKSKENAKQLRRKLNNRGYDSKILFSAGGNYYLVSYKGFNSENEALIYLSKVERKTNNTGAWIYDNF